MKENLSKIKIFNFSHPLMVTEVLSLMGSKYSTALPFEWCLTSDYNEAQIIVWDGLINPKNENIIAKMISTLSASKVLLLMGESVTLFEDHLIIKKPNLTDINCVKLPGWNLLPEEILAALEECYKKITNV